MSELHQILAVEGDLKNRAQEALANARGLFGTDALVGQTRRYRPLEEDGEPLPAEDKELAVTVSGILEDVRAHYGAWLDVAIQKEFTNQTTAADVLVDGKAVFTAVPAPALLNLEGKLLELRGVFAATPVTDPSESWEWNAARGVWISEPHTTFRTNKVPKSFVAYEATKEHPAQVQVYNEDIRVGEWTTIKTSGAISPTEKRALLDRIDKLIKAVKQARQKANNAEVVDVNMASSLFAYIYGE